MTVRKCEMCGSQELRELNGFMPLVIGERVYRYPTKSVLCRDCDSITTLPEQNLFNTQSLQRARQFIEAKLAASAPALGPNLGFRPS